MSTVHQVRRRGSRQVTHGENASPRPSRAPTSRMLVASASRRRIVLTDVVARVPGRACHEEPGATLSVGDDRLMTRETMHPTEGQRLRISKRRDGVKKLVLTPFLADPFSGPFLLPTIAGKHHPAIHHEPWRNAAFGSSEFRLQSASTTMASVV